MASGDYRRQWHKYLLLAVLNNTTNYHATLGCELSRIFHGRIPYTILDHKLGLSPNSNVLATIDFADEFQRRTQTLIDSTIQGEHHAILLKIKRVICSKG